MGAAASKPTRPLMPIIVSPTLYRVRCRKYTDFLYFLDSLDGVVRCFVVDPLSSPFSKGQAQRCSLPSLVQCFQIGRFRGVPIAESESRRRKWKYPQTVIEYFSLAKSAANRVCSDNLSLPGSKPCRVSGVMIWSRNHDRGKVMSERNLVVALPVEPCAMASAPISLA